MPKPEPTFTCATCDVTISGPPTFHVGLAFCCAGCAADGPCMCSYDDEDPADDPRPSFAFDLAPVAVADDERSLVGAGR